jgi:hypothetical protein
MYLWVLPLESVCGLAAKGEHKVAVECIGYALKVQNKE